MVLAYDALRQNLRDNPKTWLVTGVAGFIGSHLLETLLGIGQRVVGLDNFSTGKESNLEQVREIVGSAKWERFKLYKGDLADLELCRRACSNIDYVLHQGALGSVPRSIDDPLTSHHSNVTGTLNILLSARDAHVSRVVYASSSSIYGDEPTLPKQEDRIGKPLSPYAATKYFDEVYAEVFGRAYGLGSIGLRYFNVFGPRQDPDGAYAAVIPRWISALLRGQPVEVYGNGETSRDFCYVQNIVQANLLAATTQNGGAVGQAYNVAVSERTTLNQLFTILRDGLARHRPAVQGVRPVYRDFRPGDILHSLADITKARTWLGYEPSHTLARGLAEAMAWYIANG
jgi:UDP-N-acetylglucosamine 4-epimerase